MGTAAANLGNRQHVFTLLRGLANRDRESRPATGGIGAEAAVSTRGQPAHAQGDQAGEAVAGSDRNSIAGRAARPGRTL
jgi:hypothetical protein